MESSARIKNQGNVQGRRNSTTEEQINRRSARNSLLLKLGFNNNDGNDSVSEESIMEHLVNVVSENPLMKKLEGETNQRKSMKKKGRRGSVVNVKKKAPENGFMNSLLRSFVSEAENTEATNSKAVPKQKSKSIHEGLKSEASATANKVRKEEIMNRRASHLSRIAKVHNTDNNMVNIQEVIPYLVQNRKLFKEFQLEVLESNKDEKVNEAKMSVLLHSFVQRRYDDIMLTNQEKRHSMFHQPDSNLLSDAVNALHKTIPKRNSFAGIITSITTQHKDLPSFILVDDNHEDRSVISELAQECFVPQYNTLPQQNALQPRLSTLANNSFGADVL